MKKNIALKKIEEILDQISEIELSKSLEKTLTLAKQLDDENLEKWTLLESAGYFDTNIALTKDVVVPDYRNVPGQYYDKYGRPLLVSDPELSILNIYPVREGVGELETYLKKDMFLALKNPKLMQMVQKTFGVEVDNFSYNTNSLATVLSEIKNKLIASLIAKQKELSTSLIKNNINPNIPAELSGFHPLVQKTAGDLFKNEHYRQAILDTFIALVDAVKTKSGNYELDNSPLMQNVFSPKNPTLSISKNGDEQLGFMWLFSGAVMGIRNPKAHKITEEENAQVALENLAFASLLFRLLDNAELIKNEK